MNYVDRYASRITDRTGYSGGYSGRGRRSSRRNQQAQSQSPRIELTPELERNILGRVAGKATGGLAAAGNILDLPGSMIRDVMTWAPGGIKARNPLDQLLSPMSAENRTTGRELLRSSKLIGRRDNWKNAVGGMALEAAIDPLTYLTFGGSAVTKAGRVAKNAGSVR